MPIIQMTIRQAITFVLVSVLAFASCEWSLKLPFKTSGSNSVAEIRGTVLSCLQGKTIPIVAMPIYALTLEQAARIRELLDKINTLPTEPPSGQQYEELYNKLAIEVNALPSSAKTQTDKSGGYRFSNLKAGVEYWMFVFNAAQGDELLEYRAKLTGILTPRKYTMNFYFGLATEAGCTTAQ